MSDPTAPEPTTRLLNADLAPTTDAQRTWRSWDLFCLWMTSAHSLGSYSFAIGMLALGLSGWQTMLALFVGVLGLWLGSNLIGVAGQKVGVPFPVFARATFGIFGANIPALLRGLVAVFWYGIQTYLASLAVIALIVRIWPSTESWTTGGFLGQSPLGWIVFMALWTAQLLVLSYGMEIVRKVSDFAGPVVWIGMIALAIWILAKADWSIDWNARVGAVLSLPSTIAAFVAVAFLMIAYMAGPLVNYSDFARFAPSKKAIKRGNALGIPVNETAFVVLSIIISLSALKVFGDGTLDPVHLVSKIESDVLVVIAALLFALATIGINIVLNFVSPSYDISNVAPKYISFRTGGIITAVLSIVVLPWKVWGSEVAIVYFLGGVGSLMGPVFGILIVDYYLLRRQNTRIADLYSVREDGTYFFTRGVNPAALAALVISGVVAAIVALLPDDQTITALSWPIGALLGGGLMLLFSRIRPAAPRTRPVAEPEEPAAV
ncbi:permease for cytosine/purines uracil thiamine allantoin [Gordonia bronchialis DSM 43247]|uniref:Permease for cytosine/purines uracil thiamine allantoin n=1 Tax=Gordonia bronchialis (strain ATCC 25592 / DSM 43247 / BCRC 13721 / JCM 3198 / KCTC 3076 / NBRC 16047 / NCTC 10667) TaxID=526226 RepID=D0L7E0_GORB4|nr:NCS1 family nucleobase:cation symporter-1 [Gordonia bronchialis]ACY23729.1 permease for cytosine/purines uracil thiamine allantoin [Gordonia bronchialis DSM 43247]MCC3321898.1 NCS1 family nucleobase:cation symporter-1 [Gordonia bronchialis]QGS22946.1 NCS1 family nucleobase:cation symporter-1 [Gordonia bronchialis]STQ66743.1 Allantoin transport protein [Gordonia bronchialis]